MHQFHQPHQRLLTKTFVENRYWQRPPGASPGAWQELSRDATGETPIDEQVRRWVAETGNIITHPGQLGMHTQWHDQAMTLKSITLGLTVLFATPESVYGQPESSPPQFGRDAGPDAGRTDAEGCLAPIVVAAADSCSSAAA